MTVFISDVRRSEEAIKVFLRYLDSQNLKYRMATKEEQRDEIDVVTAETTYEVKVFAHDDVAIEDVSDVGKPGWIYTSKADKLVEVKDNILYFVTMKDLRKFYEATKHNYPLKTNKETEGCRGDKWRSKYRFYPLKDFNGYISIGIIKLAGE